MQQRQVKQQLINTMFGQFYGQKLTNWLNPCSTSFCKAVNACNAPSSPFNIGVNIQCTDKGQFSITFSTTYSTSIPGITNVQYLTSLTDPTIAPTVLPSKFASEILNGIIAGTTYTGTFIGNSGSGGTTQYIIATDNHGNYSNVVAVVVPSC